MPANVVKTAEDERLWQKAKARAKEQGRTGDYAYVMGIFKQMKKSERPADIPPPRGLTLDLNKADDLYQQHRDEEQLEKAVRSGMVSHTPRPALARLPGAAARLQNRGANPNVTPEHERYINGLYSSMPTPKLAINDGNYNTPEDVVKGLGFQPRDEQVWANKVRGWTRSARTNVDLRKAVYSALRVEKSLNEVTRSELARRTMMLFAEQRRQAGDFVVKAVHGRPTLVKAAPPFGNGARQSQRGKPPPPPEDAGRPRVDTHPGGKGEESAQPGQAPEDMDGDDAEQSNAEQHFENPKLDTASLDDEPQDPGNITSELQKLHKQLHDLHQHLEHTPGEIHLHNELVSLMRKVYAQPTPEGLREVRHQLHHFAQMVQGPQEGVEPPEDPNGDPSASPMGDDEEGDEEGAEEGAEDAEGDGDGDGGRDGPPGKGKPFAKSLTAMGDSLPFERGRFLFIVEPDVYVDFNDLLKGAGHRYIRRVPTGKQKPKYRYVYTVDSKHHDDNVAVGEKIKIDHGDKKGHYEVTAIHGQWASIRHDESGEIMSVRRDHLHTLFANQHAFEIVQKYRQLKKTALAALKYGSKKQKLNAIRNVDAFSKRYGLPPFKIETNEAKPEAAAAAAGVAQKLHDNWAATNKKLRESFTDGTPVAGRKTLRETAHKDLKALRDHMSNVGRQGTEAEKKAAASVIAKIDSASVKRMLEGDLKSPPTKSTDLERPSNITQAEWDKMSEAERKAQLDANEKFKRDFKKPKVPLLDVTEPGISRTERERRRLTNDYNRIKATGWTDAETKRELKHIEMTLERLKGEPEKTEPKKTDRRTPADRAAAKAAAKAAAEKERKAADDEIVKLQIEKEKIQKHRALKLAATKGGPGSDAELSLRKFENLHKDLTPFKFPDEFKDSGEKKTTTSGPSGKSKTPAKKPKGAPSKKAADDGKNRQQRREVGRHISGSRKDDADLRRMLEKGDLAELTKSGEMTHGDAARLVNKKTLLKVPTPEEMRAGGVEPAAAHLTLALAGLVKAKPGKTAKEREDYLDGVRMVKAGLETIKTVDDVNGFIKELSETYHDAGAKTIRVLDSDPGHRWADMVPKGEYDNARLLQKGGKWYVQGVKFDERQATRDKLAALGTFGQQVGIIPGKSSYGLMRVGKKWLDATREARKINDWDQLTTLHAEKTDKRKRKGGEGPQWKSWRRSTSDAPDLKGTVHKVDEADPHRLASSFQLSGVQPGENISDADLEHHLRHSEMAMHDLADVLGIDPKTVSLNGRLGLAIGARGRGKANAHYETWTKSINITRYRGAGTFAHEWGHFMDNVIAETAGASEAAARGEQVFGSTHAQHLEPKLKEAYSNLLTAMTGASGLTADAKRKVAKKREELLEKLEPLREQLEMKQSELFKTRAAKGSQHPDAVKVRAEYNALRDQHNVLVDEHNELRKLAYQTAGTSKFLADAQTFDGGKSKGYWATREEMFARAFESYVQDKLEDNGRRNSYLVDGTRAVYEETRPGIDGPAQPYPHGEERTRINKAFDELFKVLKDGDHLKKALDWLDDLRKAEATLEASTAQLSA